MLMVKETAITVERHFRFAAHLQEKLGVRIIRPGRVCWSSWESTICEML
jgi:hypothetical protein